ncbi:MAG TPA: hypothetical protein VMF58_02895 [Rhizomicrobium sp.]|nr:hypothetical protein [Rhizomicrobium sp.]
MRGSVRAGIAFAVALALCAGGVAAAERTYTYEIRHDRWSEADERDWRDFIAAIGKSDCNTLDACLRSSANPFRDTDKPGVVFKSDCAELPYILRFYFAWKRGLPFSFESAVSARGGEARDLRYSRYGNEVTQRFDVPNGANGYTIIEHLRGAVSSASYRIHPDLETPLESDFYSPKIDPQSIRPGTVVYDPAGHVGIVFDVDGKGRVHFFDAHTDFSLTEMTYDLRFTRMKPSVGAGFKNWRPQRLVGYTKRADGVLTGGHIEMAANAEIVDFSDEQFFGNGKKPKDANWKDGAFTLKGEALDYYDYVRAQLAGGMLLFEPVSEIADLAQSSCTDLHYRAQAVSLAMTRGIENRPEPDRLPPNIYGADGDWEMYSTPSRDARLKTSFKYIRDTAQRFVEMAARHDPHLSYAGSDIAGDLLQAYNNATQFCRVTYTNSDGSRTTLGYEDARKRLFAMSFDPYQCIEHRWGDSAATTCADGDVKRDWYDAEQSLRNQLERTYDAQMDFTLQQLQMQKPGIGAPPDTDVRAYLLRAGTQPPDKAP